MVVQIIIQVAFVLINVFTAKFQANLFKQYKTINHSLWAAAYVLLASIPLIWNDWLLFTSLIIMRMPVFNTALNLYRGKPFFYIGTESKIDRMMGEKYELIFYVVVAVFIINEVIIYK